MKQMFLLLMLSLTVFAVPRKIEVWGKLEKADNLEIVMETRTPLLAFTSKELQTFLAKATGTAPEIRNVPTDNATSIILGDNSFARAAGIDVNALPEEGYVIVRKGRRIFIAGRDSATMHPAQNGWGQLYERSTLSGAYDFLERFAGVRFFFPGEWGTVVPAKDGLYLPEKIDILERPDCFDRRYYSGTPKFPEEEIDGVLFRTLILLRNRTSESIIPFGHGLNRLKLVNRFSETHPEYFALMTDGQRNIDPSMTHSGHLCFNSGVREVIYQDAKAYFTGQPSTSRDLTHWSVNVASKGYFNVMTQDWLYWCGCDKCKLIAEPGRGKVYTTDSQAASDFIWEFTTEIAERLTREGIKGTITQMAYAPYNKIPKCKIADNVLVQVAVNGLGGDGETCKNDTRRLEEWTAKLGQPVSVWTYAMGKHMSKDIPGLPAMMPKHLANFLKVNQKYIAGGFFESETDFYMFNYLNYYVLCKLLWNKSLDVNDMLDDHYRTMFGEGAPMIKEIYEELEENWTRKILGNTVLTGLGPVHKIPTDFDIWWKIYSPAKIKKFEGLFDEAEKAAAKDAGAVGRLKYIRKHLLGPLKAESDKFIKLQASLDSWKITCPGEAHLRPFKSDVNEVATTVKVRQENGNMVFEYDCQEPLMADVKALQTTRDAPLTYEDSCVELLLNPSGDRINYYHFVLNVNGALTDYKYKLNDNGDIAWNGDVTYKAEKYANGWKGIISIPMKSIGINEKEFPVNFAQHRSLNNHKPEEIYYQWSPLPGRSFHDIQQWGNISFGKEAEQLILNGNFVEKGKGLADKWLVWLSGGQNTEQAYIDIDTKIFISGGRSLHFKNAQGNRMNACQYLPSMKPDTKYRLSYFIRTKDIEGGIGAGAFLYFDKDNGRPYPDSRLIGTNPWHKLSFEFTTPHETGVSAKPILGLWIWTAAGEAWFDDVRVEEVK